MQDENKSESSSGSFQYYFQPALSRYLPPQNPKLVKECLFRSVLLGKKLSIIGRIIIYTRMM